MVVMSKVTCPGRSPESMFISGNCPGKHEYSSSDFITQSPDEVAVRNDVKGRRLDSELTGCALKWSVLE